MIVAAIAYVAFGALLAGATNADNGRIAVRILLAFAALWPLIIAARIGRAIGRRLGV